MQTKSDRTRQFIIEKTAAVFNAKGYSGTSLRDLVEATGLTKGSIYGNFENKDDVALSAFDYNFGRIVDHIKNQMAGKKGIVEKLLVYPETYRNYFRLTFLTTGCPLLNTSTEADDTHPLLREKAIKALKLWRTSIEKLLQRGIDSKEIKPVNVTEFAAVLVSLIEGGVMQAKVTGRSAELNYNMNFLERMIKDLTK